METSFFYLHKKSSKINAPLILLLHGYGSNEEDLFSFSTLLPKDATIISLRAPLSLFPNSYAWYNIYYDGSVKNYDIGGARQIRDKLIDAALEKEKNRTNIENTHLVIEALLGILLIFALAFHLAQVGVIGLFLLVFLTALKGITSEHDLGEAFKEPLPFTALLVIFFVIVAVIHDQNLFSPVTSYVLSTSPDIQTPLFFIANGVLSAISDNVFVATVYMNEIMAALNDGLINREQFDNLAVAINTGTNLPSVATPNGQAAFLFLLTSSLAPLIGLSYLKMVYKALPYTIVLTIVGLICVILFI